MAGFSRHLRLAVAAAALMLSWPWPAVAHAEGGRLVLIEPDANLEHAATVALEPWGLSVHAAHVDAPPGASLPRSAARARQLAKAHDAAALAWLSETPDGLALWVYELSGDRVVAQPVAQPPPYDEAQAAALALTLKALLRHSLAAPATERFGAGEEDATRRDGLLLGLAGGVRAFGLEGGSAEPRLWLSMAYLWPALGGTLGPVVEANLGLGGVDTVAGDVDASLRAHAIALGATGRWPLGPRLDVGGLTALTVGYSRLQGELRDPSAPVDVRRANPALAARLSAGLLQRRVRIALRAGIDVPLRTQRYLVDGREVVALGSVAFEAGLGVEIFVE